MDRASAGPSSPTPSAPGPSAGPPPFRSTTSAPFRTDVVRRTALSTATLLRTSNKQSSAGAHGPGGLSSSVTGLLQAQEDDEDGDGDGAVGAAKLSEAQLAKLEEGVNVKIDGEIQILLDGFRQIVGLAMIRDKDRYLLAQESYQAEMRAHNMVRAAQSLTLLSASLKLSLILSLESGQGDDEDESFSNKGAHTAEGRPQSAKELIQDTERLRRKCAELLGNLGVGLGHAPRSVPEPESQAQQTETVVNPAEPSNADPIT
ncbi:hypothetical protein A4X13_0g1989 [Tilletia indica]|uniref:Uncharacterized protein n=1 Tax=Tilletia indica TaxID=43049 RepID=A0A177TRX7_9BASI|nr:hypothetical protein A4X13_0g1989 [Tilletia indica]